MAEYRIRHTDTDLEGEAGTFDNDREAVAWWFDYAHQHPAVQAWEIVLERDDGGRRWASVSTHVADAPHSGPALETTPAGTRSLAGVVLSGRIFTEFGRQS